MILHRAIFPSIEVVSQFFGWRLRLRLVGYKHTDLRPERNDLGLLWSLKGLILGLGGLYSGLQDLIWGLRGPIWDWRGLI